MAWKKARDPNAPVAPAFHHPDRCMQCGHLDEEHDSEVGCLQEGGTKYIEDENGVGRHACSCLQFVASPEKEQKKDNEE